MKITVEKIRKGLRYLRHYGVKEFFIRLGEKMEAEHVPYAQWYERHKASPEQLEKQKREAGRWKNPEKIGILVPLYHTPEPFLRAMIESVQAQTYAAWQLCLADGSGDDSVRRVVEEYLADKRISYQHLEKNGGIAGNTNAALAMAKGGWIAFLDHDDMLAPDALYEAAKKIQSGCDMVYTDEDKIDGEGKNHFDPHFKPEFNEDLLRSNNYITHFLLVKREIADKVGGIREEYEGAQDYDFILRCSEEAENIGHVPRILYHWRCHDESTSSNPFSKQYAVESGRKAIQAHLDRLGEHGTVTPTKDMGFYAVRYRTEGEPLVSVIIPSRDEVESLKKCLAAIEKSSYRNYEIIIVENNSSEETFRFYESLGEKGRMDGSDVYEGKRKGGQRICVAVWREGFNYSALNNYGAKFAKGSYLVLMNNDIEVITRDWMEQLLGNCMRKKIGVAGTKLYYPDHTIQHAGIVVGIGGNKRGIAMNMFAGKPGNRSGYLHKASLQMNYTALTAAFFMVRAEVFREAGGFSENLAVAFNDVDFCLKVCEKGYRNVYVPWVEAYHYESKSRGAEDSKEKVDRFQTEIEYMRTRWIGILKGGDPCYNPNFSAIYNDYSIGDNSR